MEEVEKLKTANANLEQRKEELVKELEQVTKFSMTRHLYKTCPTSCNWQSEDE